MESEKQKTTEGNDVGDKLSYVRVTAVTKKRLDELIKKANKKELGRRLVNDDVVAHALSLVTDGHIEELRFKSLSNENKIELRYREYVKQNGPVSKDDYYGKLLEKLT